jgi:hypothetical protein
MFRNVPMTFAVATLSLGLIACGEDPPPDPPPQPTNTAPPPTPTPMPTADPVPEPTTGIETGPCDANRTLALKTAIEGRQKAELSAHMKPEGVFRCEMVNEGGTIEVPVTLQQGKCYSMLAGSFPNITEVDMKLVFNLTDNVPPVFQAIKDQPAAQDSETGPTASIGRKGSCFKNPWPLPAPMKVVVTATSGAGPLAVQVYSK